MSATRWLAHAAVRWGAASGLLALGCGGGGGSVRPPCGLNDQTKLVDDPKLIADLEKFKSLNPPPTNPNADELDGHCRAVWQEIVEDRHCGQVQTPAFCDTCSPEAEKTYCNEGNGHDLVMQHCRVAALKTFQDSYLACKDFVLCAGSIQASNVVCKANRQ